MTVTSQDSASVAADVAMDTVSSDDDTAIATDNTQVCVATCGCALTYTVHV